MSDQFSLSGRNAIITGATRGIGLAMAHGFLEAGATVTLCGRKQEGVDAACAELTKFGDRVLGMVAHVGRSESLTALVEAARQRFGTVNVLVICCMGFISMVAETRRR